MEYRISLVNGKYGYGKTGWEALVNAVGERKADKIAANIKHITSAGIIYAKNGVIIGMQERRYLPV